MDFRNSEFYKALRLLFFVHVGGGLGYYVLGLLNPNKDAVWTFLDCFYMSTITLTTVGYSETLPGGIEHFAAARIYTMLLLMFGTGVLVYAASAGTAFIVEGELKHLLEKRRMRKEIEQLSGHFIVCGAGTTGVHVVQELIDTGRKFVVVDLDPERIHIARNLGAKFYIEGDATEDATLLSAGIERAKGLASCLPDDKDNLFVTVTARQLSQDIRIVSQNEVLSARSKLLQAGANATVSPNFIGGLRLVSELIRPSVTTFLDLMLRDKKANIRFAEVLVGKNSPLAGKTLGDVRIDKNPGIPVLALRVEGQNEFNYEPTHDDRLEPGVIIIVLGPRAKVDALEKLAAGK